MTADLRDAIARAIHRYDYANGLSGNDIPSRHHRGEASAVLAAIQGRYVPPPPGSTVEKIPGELLALIHPSPYLSTACDTAQRLQAAAGREASYVEDRVIDRLTEHARMLHQRCRLNNKFTGQLCVCGCHADGAAPHCDPTSREQQQ